MGEESETISLTRACFIRLSGFVPLCLSTGATVLATTSAPSDIKKERKIQSAADASADVAMLLKRMENRMEKRKLSILLG